MTIGSYSPAWNVCSAGTTPAIHRCMPSLDDLGVTPGVSRNFSALRLCNWSHPFVFNSRSQPLLIICYLAAVLHHLQQEPFPIVYRFKWARARRIVGQAGIEPAACGVLSCPAALPV